MKIETYKTKWHEMTIKGVSNKNEYSLNPGVSFVRLFRTLWINSPRFCWPIILRISSRISATDVVYLPSICNDDFAFSDCFVCICLHKLQTARLEIIWDHGYTGIHDVFPSAKLSKALAATTLLSAAQCDVQWPGHHCSCAVRITSRPQPVHACRCSDSCSRRS